MLRTKQIILASLSGIMVAIAQNSKKDYKSTLNGLVKSIRTTTYVALDKGGGHYGKGSVAKGTDNLLTHYDRKGNITERIAYYTNGNLWYTKNYVYEGNDVKKETLLKKTEPKLLKSFEEGEEGLIGRVAYRYDKKGQKTEESSYDAKGVLLWRYVYRYDNKGHIIEKDNFDTQGILLSRESYKYDQEGNLLEKLITMNHQTAYKCTWKYNEKGKEITKEEYFTELITPEKINKIIENELLAKGALWKKFRYSYDNKGNRSEVFVYNASSEKSKLNEGAVQNPSKEALENTPKRLSYEELPNPKLLSTNEYDNLRNLWVKDIYVYDKEGKIIEVRSIDNEDKTLFRYTYKYDDKGNEIDRVSYGKNNEVIQRTTHSFDSKNNLTERSEYDTYGELIQKNIYKYNEKGQKIEQQGLNSNGSLAFLIKFIYNATGELIESLTYNTKGELTSKLIQQYKMDNYNNWTKLTQYTDGKATFITERIIEYYR